MTVIKKLNYLLDRESKLQLSFMFICIMIGSVAELLGVSVIFPIVDIAMDSDSSSFFQSILRNIAGTDDSRTIILILVMMVALVYILKNIYLSWMNARIYYTASSVKRQLATKLMKAYMSQTYEFFVYHNSSELIRNINQDTGQLYEVIVNCLMILQCAVTSVFIVGFLAVTNPGLTLLVSILLGACAAVILLALQRRTREYGRLYQKASGDLIMSLQEALNGIKEIKIHGSEEFFVTSYDIIFKKQTDYQRKSKLFNTIPKYLLEAVCISGIMAYWGYNILTNPDYRSLMPQLAIFATAAFKLMPMVNSIYAYINTIVNHQASIDLVYNDIKQSNELVQRIEETKGAPVLEFESDICFQNVSFAYTDSEGKVAKDMKPVLKNVSFSIKKGESVGFRGVSGGGKTTTIDLMMGLLRPTEGKILVDGIDISNMGHSFRANIGYIPQNIYLTDSTIRKNVAFGIKDDEIDDYMVWESLKKARLYDFVNQTDKGIESEVGENGVRISGGQRQRIGIARALYRNPEIIVFDEATSALDNETEAEIMASIEELQGEKTLIMIAHRLSTLKKCDKIFTVGDGTIAETACDLIDFDNNI